MWHVLHNYFPTNYWTILWILIFISSFSRLELIGGGNERRYIKFVCLFLLYTARQRLWYKWTSGSRMKVKQMLVHKCYLELNKHCTSYCHENKQIKEQFCSYNTWRTWHAKVVDTREIYRQALIGDTITAGNNPGLTTMYDVNKGVNQLQ